MGANSRHSVKRPLVVLAKVGYHEITTVIAISVVFWLFTLPVVTIGATLLALLDVMGDVYHDGSPRTERGRVRRFAVSVRANLVRGLPLTVLVLFVFVNTVWYFAIVLSEPGSYYLVGGLVGVYALLVAFLFSFRLANVAVRTGADWRSAARRAGTGWLRNPHFSVLQISVATIMILVSVAFPVALLLALPGWLALFELVSYEELFGSDPRTVLARYRRDV